MVRLMISPPLLFSPVKGEILGRSAFADCFKFTPPLTGQPKAGKGEGEELHFGKESR